MYTNQPFIAKSERLIYCENKYEIVQRGNNLVISIGYW